MTGLQAPLSAATSAAPWEDSDMAWALPQFSKGDIDRAGTLLINDDFNDRLMADDPIDAEAWQEYEHIVRVVNNWRSSHSFPLNTFQITLRQKAQRVDTQTLVSQRIKRLPAIELKLRTNPHMKLSQMQDLGGCRAVVRSVRGVYRLVDSYKHGKMLHTLSRLTDYIGEPRLSGYRSVHLMYRHRSKAPSPYEGLRIEIQIRSQLQHAWATAVETVGTFLRQALKSSQGEEPWLRFFALMGTAMALREKTAPVPGTPTDSKDLVTELRRAARELQVESRLRAYGRALRTAGEKGKKGAKYFLLNLDTNAKKLDIQTFGARESEDATEKYLAAEKAIGGAKSGREVVLVSVTSLAALRRAYPSYFLDTDRFIAAVKTAISA